MYAERKLGGVHSIAHNPSLLSAQTSQLSRRHIDSVLYTAILASSPLRTFPVGVSGNEGTSRICEGRLYGARCCAAYCANSVSEVGEDGESCTKATTSSPPSTPSTDRPMTAERTTAGCAFSTASTSAG